MIARPKNGVFTFQVNIDPASFSRHWFSESMPSWDSWDDRHHYRWSWPATWHRRDKHMELNCNGISDINGNVTIYLYTHLCTYTPIRLMMGTCSGFNRDKTAKQKRFTNLGFHLGFWSLGFHLWANACQKIRAIPVTFDLVYLHRHFDLLVGFVEANRIFHGIFHASCASLLRSHHLPASTFGRSSLLKMLPKWRRIREISVKVTDCKMQGRKSCLKEHRGIYDPSKLYNIVSGFSRTPKFYKRFASIHFRQVWKVQAKFG